MSRSLVVLAELSERINGCQLLDVGTPGPGVTSVVFIKCTVPEPIIVKILWYLVVLLRFFSRTLPVQVSSLFYRKVLNIFFESMLISCITVVVLFLRLLM